MEGKERKIPYITQQCYPQTENAESKRLLATYINHRKPKELPRKRNLDQKKNAKHAHLPERICIMQNMWWRRKILLNAILLSSRESKDMRVSFFMLTFEPDPLLIWHNRIACIPNFTCPVIVKFIVSIVTHCPMTCFTFLQNHHRKEKKSLKDFVKKSTPRNNQLKKRHEKNDFHTEESTTDLLKMALPLDIWQTMTMWRQCLCSGTPDQEVPCLLQFELAILSSNPEKVL